jgi:hypothetical protein
MIREEINLLTGPEAELRELVNLYRKDYFCANFFYKTDR